MPKAKQKLCRSQEISHCPNCGKRFASETRVLQHMNQPSNTCGLWMDHFSSYLRRNASTTTWNGTETHHPTKLQHQAGANCNGDLEEDIADYGLASDGFGLGAVEDTVSHAVSEHQGCTPVPIINSHPNMPSIYPGGTTFMDWFFDDQYTTLRWQNLYYPFALAGDWQLALWLLRSWLSMAAIDDFLSLQLVKQLPISFRSAKELCLHTEMLPSSPRWKSHTLLPQVPTKCKPIIYYQDPLECLQSLLSHPLFTSHISFIPRRVWSSSAWIVHIYEEWMSGNHAWSLQIPNGAMLLGVVLSSDKTNISVMTGNRMAHPLLLSLTNIDANIRSKGSLHGHVLLALLLVVSFIHGKTHVRSLLSDQLVHKSLDFVLKPLKVAAAVGVMMSDPVGNLHYCFTPLIAYIADTPEQSLLACISPKASPVSTTVYKEFGDPFPHPPRTAGRTLDNIKWACIEADLNDFKEFLKAAKRYSLSEVLHHFHRLFWDHDLQWCSIVLGPAEIDYRFSLIQTPVGYRSFREGVLKLKQVTGCDHRAMQRYIVGVITGAVPPKFLLSINALLSFCYLAQMPRFDHDALARVETALKTFHDNKAAIISSGGRQGSNGPLQHWEIPKLELLQHVVSSIHNSGAVMQWMANVTEHAHITEIKQPAHAGNNQDYYAQIARHLDRRESGEDDEDQEDEHELDFEALHVTHYYTPSRTSINYFESAEALASGAIPNAVLPHRIFASSTTAFCLAFKPSLHVMIDEAAETFGLSDLRPAITDYIRRNDHLMTEVLNPSTEKVQIWFKVRVQQPSYHDRLSLESPQSLLASPPSAYLPGSQYDFAVISQADESNWPLNGLRGKFFRVQDVNQDLLVELQGATINEQLLITWSHYILDCCEKMLPVIMKHIPQADVNSLLSISSLQNGDEFLYCNGCWEPVDLPQILRLSESLSTTLSQPRWNRPRREAVQRHIPRTSQEEAVEGTFLPTASSEEWQVAKWLNKLALAMWAFIPGSPSTVVLGSTVTHRRITCSTAALHGMNRCLWFAESSCKPIKDNLMSWKPDMVLREDSLGRAFRPQPELSWKDVISFMELTSGTYSLSDDIGTVCNAVMCKAYAVFASQPGRWFLFALSIAGQKFRTHMFDRSGVIHSRPYDIH
ncbi:hypothetical protein PISMIDRAFT_13073 [Pisolithus microcarpus 441]|uniref:C2H2-type domain-containing protein n=1 Tax=Pisolithus microcarpus 441 TaxID=765257 RepID=A0A0C9Y6K7_9AGAM|nr:hypothetical protein PISMIDRAFT_13073 [Pisolithus microcarpus 441]